MNFNLDVANLIFYFVSFNAIILSILLIFSKKKLHAKRWLGWLVLAFGFNLINHRLLNEVYLQNSSFTLRGIPTIFTFGPLIYFYVLSIRGIKIERKHLFLLIPFVIDVVYHLVKGWYVYQYDLKNRSTYFNHASYPLVQIEFLVHDGLAIIFTLWLFIKSYRNAQAAHQTVQDNFSHLSKNKSFLWLQQLLFLFAVLLVIWIGYHLVEIVLFPKILYYSAYLPLHLMLAILILYLGYRGLMQPEITSIWTVPKKYKTSAIDLSNMQKERQKLMDYVEREKPYLNSELKLQDLSEATKIPMHQISQILSEGLQTNFYQFINNYRVKHVKNLLIDQSLSHLTILGIALDAGFNSKNTFYRAFKNTTGISPTVFREQNKK